MSRPVCFMVMPFNKKSAPDRGEIDFDALWDWALAPLLRELGYEPIRADEDLGASIIADMLIRLTASDLVVADLSLANPNVYYEVGIRHAARRPGCVLIAAEWASPRFDFEQIRRLPYPLPAGELTDEKIRAIHQSLREPIAKAATAQSPVYQLVPGYPGDLPRTDSAKFQAFVAHLTEFQAAAATIRAAPRQEKAAMAADLVKRYPLSRPQSPAIILELLGITRDHLGFPAALEFIGRMPADLAQLPFVLEQESLALGKIKRFPEAIAKLEQLIRFQGPDPERLGILGGRYKEMWRVAVREDENSLDARRYLARAIDSYSRGMWLNLNEYYCASNLPRLLRSRRGPDDNDLARQAADIARNACQRARRMDKHDEWLNATLLGAAFDSGDVDEAEALLSQIAEEGAVPWKLDSTLEDLRASLTYQSGTLAAAAQDRLGAVLGALEMLARPDVP
jgi:tetratricopeptide (TPR) repeat protein